MNIELSFSDITNIIIEILSGEKISSINYVINTPVLFVQPTGAIKLYLNYVEKNSLEKYLSEGYISESSIEKNPDLLNSFFSTEDQQDLEEIQKKLKGYYQILKKRDKKSKLYEEDLSKIGELKLKESLLLNKKSTIKLFSAEYKAREERFIEQFLQCTLDLNKRTRLISNLCDIDSTIYNIDMLNKDLNSYLDFYFGYDTEIIRKIARSDQWRSYVLACDKNFIFLFNKNGQDLSIDQLNLISWTKYYLNINEMPLKDRPSEDIFDDDEKLDSYLAEFTRKIQAELDISKKAPIKDKDHIVITADSPDYIKYHKHNFYSDTSIITGKAKEDATKYSESDQFKKIRKRIERNN